MDAVESMKRVCQALDSSAAGFCRLSDGLIWTNPFPAVNTGCLYIVHCIDMFADSLHSIIAREINFPPAGKLFDGL